MKKTGRPKTSDKNPSLSTRAEAAELIQVHEDTLRSYERLAIIACEPFRESMQVDGVTQSRQPLTQYQVWVLGKITMMHRKIPRGCSGVERIKRYLKSNPHKLSYEAYLNEISQPLTA